MTAVVETDTPTVDPSNTRPAAPARRLIQVGMFVAPVAAGVLYISQHSAVVAVAGTAATHARGTWSMLALILALSAFPMAAWTLGAAASQPLPLLRTTQVELAGTFVNRIAPNGIGRAVVSGRFLVTRGLRSDQAAAAVATTVVAGLIVHTGGIVFTASLGGVGSMHHLPTLKRPVALGAAVLVGVAVAGWAVFDEPIERAESVSGPAR